MDAPFDPTLESDIRELMKDVPPPVRAFFASGKVETIAKSLMLKNQLHLDQGAVVEREIIFLLLGLKSPDEFNQALATEANLNQQTIASIVQDVNTQIFSPLREEMRKGVEALGKKPPQIPAVMPVRQPTTAPAMPRPMSVLPAPAAGASQPTSHFHLENKLPARPSAQVPVAASALSVPVPVLPQQPFKPIPVQPSSINVLPTESKPAQQIPVPV
ncbi:MAG: hypothetical protein Q8P23_02875, partial [bacterium]|nr:hypothetical protein [bacterium]